MPASRTGGVCSVLAACAAVLALVGCSSSSPATSSRHSSTARSTGSTAHTAAPSSSSSAQASSSASASPSTAASSPSTRPPSSSSADRTLPRGGHAILGHYRVVAFYGAAGNPQLGALGTASPETIAPKIVQRANGFAHYGLPVQPAMELIATVAQGSPQPDGSYSAPIPAATIRHYLTVAHRYRMLLVLDLQPGRTTFYRQAQALHDVLLDPSVELGLDPEWKVSAGQRPGNGLIGSSGSGDVDRTIDYVSGLIRAHHLPHKLVVVHEFTSSMLPDRAAIRARPGVEVAFHADGFGHPSSKIAVLHKLAFPGRPMGVGFKLFFTQDSRLMTPGEVMGLHPRPDIITYQ